MDDATEPAPPPASGSEPAADSGALQDSAAVAAAAELHTDDPVGVSDRAEDAPRADVLEQAERPQHTLDKIAEDELAGISPAATTHVPQEPLPELRADETAAVSSQEVQDTVPETILTHPLADETAAVLPSREVDQITVRAATLAHPLAAETDNGPSSEAEDTVPEAPLEQPPADDNNDLPFSKVEDTALEAAPAQPSAEEADAVPSLEAEATAPPDVGLPDVLPSNQEEDAIAEGPAEEPAAPEPPADGPSSVSATGEWLANEAPHDTGTEEFHVDAITAEDDPQPPAIPQVERASPAAPPSGNAEDHPAFSAGAVPAAVHPRLASLGSEAVYPATPTANEGDQAGNGGCSWSPAAAAKGHAGEIHVGGVGEEVAGMPPAPDGGDGEKLAGFDTAENATAGQGDGWNDGWEDSEDDEADGSLL